MDRRNFLGFGLLATLVGVTNLSIPNPFQSNGESKGTTLFVSFTNPSIGSSIEVPVPFNGRFRGIKNQQPSDIILSVKKYDSILVTGEEVLEGSNITISVIECSPGCKKLSGWIVMERY